MIYVVLGMHKSGTTLVSQTLHHSGVDMGEFDPRVGYDGGNKYEREESLELDMELLGAPDYEVLHLAGRRDIAPTAEQRGRMRAMIAACEDRHADWGMKDPRMCLTYHLWEPELPPHKLVVVYRDPAQVWPRFMWKGRRMFLTNFRRAYAYLSRWQEHNRNILAVLDRGDRDTLVLEYHALMTEDAEFERLQEFVGRSLVDQRLPEMYRSRMGRDVFLRTGDWLLARRTGCSTQDTLAELAAVRAGQIGQPV